jgi:deazaflavin-dependent oxidoreductase (nitroreductase family)
MSTAHAIETTHAPSFVPVLNPMIRQLLRIGLPMGPNVLLTVRGRKSGAAHTFPVALLELDGRRYVQGTFGETNWVRNLRAAGSATITKGRGHEEVDAIEIPPDDAAPILRDALAPFLRRRTVGPLVGRFFGFADATTLDDYRIAAARHPMFELRTRG